MYEFLFSMHHKLLMKLWVVQMQQKGKAENNRTFSVVRVTRVTGSLHTVLMLVHGFHMEFSLDFIVIEGHLYILEV